MSPQIIIDLQAYNKRISRTTNRRKLLGVKTARSKLRTGKGNGKVMEKRTSSGSYKTSKVLIFSKFINS